MPVSFSDYLKAGLQHFDIGGSVGQAAGNLQANPSQALEPSFALGQGNLGQQTGNFGINGLVSSLTPQNSYSATAPLNGQNLQDQVYGSQAGLAQVQGGQNQLAQALQAQSQGQGPNPAQAMLNQQSNQNIQQGTGMIASQKGISPALAQALASQQTGQAQQAAAAQGATMGAQQQVAAQGALSNLYGQQAQQNLSSESTAGGLQNQSALGAQGINAGVSAQNTAAQQGTESGILGGVGGLSQLKGILNKGGEVTPMTGSRMPGYDDGGTVTSSQPTPMSQQQVQAPAQTPAAAPTASEQIARGILQQAGVPVWASGVVVPQVSQGAGNAAKGAKAAYNYLNPPSTVMTNNGMALPQLGQSALNPGANSPAPLPTSPEQMTEPQLGDSAMAPSAAGLGADYGAGNAALGATGGFGDAAAGAGGTAMAGGAADAGGAAAAGGGAAAAGGGDALGSLVALASKGGKIPPHLQHVAGIYHPQVFAPAKNTEQLKAAGGAVPGKAKVKGDSPKNDTVKTMLSPGELVIPRSVMQSKDPAAEAAKFVADKLREKGGGYAHEGDFKEALKAAIAGRKGA